MSHRRLFMNLVLIIAVIFSQFGSTISVQAAQPGVPFGIIAYVSEDGNIWVAAPDGSKSRQWTAGGNYRSPAISPDGTMIAYVHRIMMEGEKAPNASEIGLLDIASGQMHVLVSAERAKTYREITTEYVSYASPRWNSDGKALFYIRSDFHYHEDIVHKIEIGSGQKDAGFTPIENVIGFDVSAQDGKIVVAPSIFNKIIQYPSSGILLANSDGTQPAPLYTSTGDSFFSEPRWSPDGSWIAWQKRFVSEGDFGIMETLVLFHLDGPDLDDGYPMQVYSAPNWSPDGKYLVFKFVSNFGNWPTGIQVGNVETGEIVYHFPGNEPDWGPEPTALRGRITDEAGRPVEGVALTTKDGQALVSTDAQGNYNTSQLANGNNILTPVKEGYSFTPSIVTVTAPGPAKDQDFLAERAEVKILTPVTNTRLMRCQADVRGIARQNGLVKIWRANAPAGADKMEMPIIIHDEPMGEMQVQAGAEWSLSKAKLAPGDNYIYAALEIAGKQSGAAGPVHVNCGQPRLISYSPEKDYDLDLHTAIEFEFDTPVDPNSVNTNTVLLYSETLQKIPGKIIPRSGKETTSFEFNPEIPLNKATEYTLTLTRGIHAQAPDNDIKIDQRSWTFIASGPLREKLVAAIRDLADVTADKMERDVGKTATVFSDIYDIDTNYQVINLVEKVNAIWNTFLFLKKVNTKGWVGIKEFLKKDIHKIGPEDITGTISLILDVEALGGDWVHKNEWDWNQVGMTEQDYKTYKSLVGKQRSNLNKSELELLLLGSDRASPLRIPILINRRTSSVTFVEGAGSLRQSIRQKAENVINQLPDSLPPGYPVEEVILEIQNAHKSIEKSTSETVSLTYMGYQTGPASQEYLGPKDKSLGMLASVAKQAYQLIEASNKDARVQVNLLVEDLAEKAITYIVLIPGLSVNSPVTWSLEAISSGLEDGSPVLDAFSVNQMFQRPARNQMLDMPMLLLRQLPQELGDTYDLSSEIMDTVLDYNKLPVFPKSNQQSSLKLVKFSLSQPQSQESKASLNMACEPGEEEQVSHGAMISGVLRCSVANQGSADLQVQARATLRSLVGEAGSRPILGEGRTQDWVSLPAGQQVELLVPYYVLAPQLTNQDTVVALVNLLTVSPPSAGMSRIGPFPAILSVATDQSPLAAYDSILEGEIAASEEQTAEFVLPENTGPVTFLMNHSDGMSLAFTLEDPSGNRFASDGTGGEPEFTGFTGAYSAGGDDQAVTFKAPAAGLWKVRVSGVVSARGRGYQYALGLMPAVKSREYEFTASPQELTPEEVQFILASAAILVAMALAAYGFGRLVRSRRKVLF